MLQPCSLPPPQLHTIYCNGVTTWAPAQLGLHPDKCVNHSRLLQRPKLGYPYNLAPFLVEESVVFQRAAERLKKFASSVPSYLLPFLGAPLMCTLHHYHPTSTCEWAKDSSRHYLRAERVLVCSRSAFVNSFILYWNNRLTEKLWEQCNNPFPHFPKYHSLLFYPISAMHKSKSTFYFSKLCVIHLLTLYI